MKIIDAHVHLGDIYGFDPAFRIETRTKETTHPNKKDVYEMMGFGNIYFGRLNYLFKPLIVSAAREETKYANLPNLQDSMARSGVEKSVILPIEPNVSTETILEICKKHNGLVPFASVHPYDKDKKAKLSKYIKAGCKGLKLHPVIQKVAADDRAFLEVIEEVAQYDVPVLLHCGWGSIGRGDFGSIGHYKKILSDFPKIKFIFAHMGFYEPQRTLDAIDDHKNVYVDTSWQPAGIVRKAIDKLGVGRILLGTDWPYALQETPIKIVMRATEGRPDLRERIFYMNAEELIPGLA